MAAKKGNPPRYVNRLNSVEGCRKETARIIRECILRERDSLEGYRLVQMIHTLSGLMVERELEERIQQLEREISGASALHLAGRLR